jgi:hypothetical protein
MEGSISPRMGIIQTFPAPGASAAAPWRIVNTKRKKPAIRMGDFISSIIYQQE